MTVDIEKNKQEFNDLLRSVGREGTDYLIEDLEDLGFYDAPSSTRFHLARWLDASRTNHSDAPRNGARIAKRQRDSGLSAPRCV